LSATNAKINPGEADTVESIKRVVEFHEAVARNGKKLRNSYLDAAEAVAERTGAAYSAVGRRTKLPVIARLAEATTGITKAYTSALR
jgi:hypothetical protein